MGIHGSKKQPYDAEFREGTVRIVIETGKPVPEVAEELGLNPGHAAQLGLSLAPQRDGT
ncbi:transposase [Streptomyces bluensis]|uniref:transposase n=1 Tax=Streptomyces bluensis TaxID=33897 RepID=UPI00331C75F3